MLMHRVARGSLAVVSLAALAACADAPTATSTNLAPPKASAALVTQLPGAGELWICKAGNAAGTFHYDIAYTHTNSTGSALPSLLASTTADVAVDACVQVGGTPVLGSSGATYSAVITETPQTDWALTSVGAIKSDGSAVAITVDLVAGTASGANLKFGNDRGTTVVFTNTFTPPPPPNPEGCSPGYYKKHLQPGRDQLLGDIFSNTPSALAGFTLQQALFFEGGPTLTDKQKILLRQAAAAYFNIGYLGGSYPLTLQQLVDLVNTALASGNATTIENAKNVLAGDNNLEGPRC